MVYVQELNNRSMSRPMAKSVGTPGARFLLFLLAVIIFLLLLLVVARKSWRIKPSTPMESPHATMLVIALSPRPS